jgi:hypothetical protein
VVIPTLGEKATGARVNARQAVGDHWTEDDHCSLRDRHRSQFDIFGCDPLRIGGCRQHPHALFQDAIEPWELFGLFKRRRRVPEYRTEFSKQLFRDQRMLGKQKESPSQGVGRREVRGPEENRRLADQFAVGHSLPRFIPSLKKQRKNILRRWRRTSKIDHSTDKLFQFVGVFQHRWVGIRTSTAGDQSTYSHVVVRSDPTLGRPSDLIGEFGLVEAEEQLTGDPQHEVVHLARHVVDITHFPTADHCLSQLSDTFLIPCVRRSLKWARHHAAMAFMRFTIHIQQTAREPALCRILGTGDRKKMGMKQLGIAEDLVNVLGPECKDDPLVTIAEFREFTLRLVQTEHTSGGICGEIEEPILLRGRKG